MIFGQSFMDILEHKGLLCYICIKGPVMAPVVDCIPNSGELKYAFYSNDHEPPHIHVLHNGGEWEIAVFFLECSSNLLKYKFKVPRNRNMVKRPIMSRFQKQIIENIVQNKAKLYLEWQQKVNRGS